MNEALTKYREMLLYLLESPYRYSELPRHFTVELIKE